MKRSSEGEEYICEEESMKRNLLENAGSEKKWLYLWYNLSLYLFLWSCPIGWEEKLCMQENREENASKASEITAGAEKTTAIAEKRNMAWKRNGAKIILKKTEGGEEASLREEKTGGLYNQALRYSRRRRNSGCAQFGRRGRRRETALEAEEMKKALSRNDSQYLYGNQWKYICVKWRS